MLTADLQTIREINRNLPFAHPIAETTTTMWLVARPGTGFDPAAPTVGDLCDVFPVTVNEAFTSAWGGLRG